MLPRGIARNNSRTTGPASLPQPAGSKQAPDTRRPHRASMISRAEASFTEPELRSSPARSGSAMDDSRASTPQEPSQPQPEDSPKKPRNSVSSATGLPARRLSIGSTGASTSPLRDDIGDYVRDVYRRDPNNASVSFSLGDNTPIKQQQQRRPLSVSRPDYDNDGSGGSMTQVLPPPSESSISTGSAPPSLPRHGGPFGTGASFIPDGVHNNSSGSVGGPVSPNRWPKAWQQQIVADMVAPTRATSGGSGGGSRASSSPSPFVPGGSAAHSGPTHTSPSPSLGGPGRRGSERTGSAQPPTFPVGTLPLSGLSNSATPGLAGSTRNSRSNSMSGAAEVPRSPASVASSFGTDTPTPTPRSILKQPGSQSRYRDKRRRISFVPPIHSPDRRADGSDEGDGSETSTNSDGSSFSDDDDHPHWHAQRAQRHPTRRRGDSDDDDDDFEEPSLSYSDGSPAPHRFYHKTSPEQSTNQASNTPAPSHPNHATAPPVEEDDITIRESDNQRRRRLDALRANPRDDNEQQKHHDNTSDDDSLDASHSRSPSSEPPSPDKPASRAAPTGAGGRERSQGEEDTITEPHSHYRQPYPQAPLPAVLDPRRRHRWPTERRGGPQRNADDSSGDDEDDPPTEAAGTQQRPRRGSRERLLPDEDGESDTDRNERDSNRRRRSPDSSFETPVKQSGGNTSGGSRTPGSDGPRGRSSSRVSSAGTASPDSGRRRHRHRHHRRHREGSGDEDDDSRSGVDSSFSSASSRASSSLHSPFRGTAPPASPHPSNAAQTAAPSKQTPKSRGDIGLPPLPTSPRQQDVTDTSVGSRGRDGSGKGGSHSHPGNSNNNSSGSGIFPPDESSTFLNDVSYTPTASSSSPPTPQNQSQPQPQAAHPNSTLADLTVSALSSVESPRRAQQQQQQLRKGAGRHPSSASSGSGAAPSEEAHRPPSFPEDESPSGRGSAGSNSNSNSIGKVSLERPPSSITEPEDDRSLHSAAGLPDVATLAGGAGATPEKDRPRKRHSSSQHKTRTTEEEAAATETSPQRRHRRRSGSSSTSTKASKSNDTSKASEGSAQRQRRKHRTSHPGSHNPSASSTPAKSRRRTSSKLAHKEDAAPAMVALKPLPKNQQHRPPLEPVEEECSGIRSVELLAAEDAAREGLVRPVRGDSGHSTRHPKVLRPRSPVEEDAESITIDESRRIMSDDANYEDTYYYPGVSPKAHEETARPRSRSRSNSAHGSRGSVADGVAPDAFDRAEVEDVKGNVSQHSTPQESRSPSSSHASLSRSARSSKVKRTKLVVVQKRRRKNTPATEDDPVVQVSLLPMRRASEILSLPNGESPALEKLYEHIASNPTSARNRSNSVTSGSRGATEPQHQTEEDKDRLLFRRALSAASSRSASRRSSLAPSALPSVRELHDHAAANVSLVTPSNTGSTRRRRSHHPRRTSTSRRGSLGSSSKEPNTVEDVTTASATDAQRHRRRHHHHHRRPSAETAPVAAPYVEGQNDEFYRSLVGNLRQPAPDDYVDDGTGAALFQRSPAGITPINVRAFPHLLSLAGDADARAALLLPRHNPMSDDDEADAPAAKRIAAQQQRLDGMDTTTAAALRGVRADNAAEENNAGVPTFVAVPVIRHPQDQRTQPITGEVPLLDHLIGEETPSSHVPRLANTHQEEQEAPLSSFLKPSAHARTPLQAQAPRSQPYSRVAPAGGAEGDSFLFPYRGVAPTTPQQPAPTFAPPLATENVPGLSRAWQETLRPSQNKRRRQDEEAMLFGSAAPATADLDASERAYAAAAEFRGAGTGLPPSATTPESEKPKAPVKGGQPSLQSTPKALLPFRKHDPEEDKMVKKASVLPPPLTSLAAKASPRSPHHPSAQSSHDDSGFSSTLSSLSPERKPPADKASEEAADESDGEMAGVLTEPAVQAPGDAEPTPPAHEKKKSSPHAPAPPPLSPPPPPAASTFNVFDPVTEPLHNPTSPTSSATSTARDKSKKRHSGKKDDKKGKADKKHGKKRRSPSREKSKSRKERQKDKERGRRDSRARDKHSSHRGPRDPDADPQRQQLLETSIAYQLEKIMRQREEEEAHDNRRREKAEKEKEKERKKERARHKKEPEETEKKKHKRKNSRSRSPRRSGSRHHRENKKGKKHKPDGGSKERSTQRFPSVPNVFERATGNAPDDEWNGSTPRHSMRQPPPPPPPPPPEAAPPSSSYRSRQGTPPIRPSSYTPRGAASPYTPAEMGADDIDPERAKRRANIQKALDDIAERRRQEAGERGGSYGDARSSRYRRPSTYSRDSSYTPRGSLYGEKEDDGLDRSRRGSRYTPRPSTRWEDYVRDASRDSAPEYRRGFSRNSPPRSGRTSYFADEDERESFTSPSARRRQRAPAAPPPPPTPPTPPAPTSTPSYVNSADIVLTPPRGGTEAATRRPTAPPPPPPPPPPPGASPVSRGESPEEIIKEYEVSDPAATKKFAKELGGIVEGLRAYQGLA